MIATLGTQQLQCSSVWPTNHRAVSFAIGRAGFHNGKVNHGNHIDPPTTLQWMRSQPGLKGIPIDPKADFQIQFLEKAALSLCSPLQGRLSRGSLWSEKVLNLGASFSIFCFAPHPIYGFMNNAEVLVARGAMGDGFTQSPLPGAITSEGKSSQDTDCSPIGSPVAGQRSSVNNHLYFFHCDGPQGSQ